jgi:hypothetical protein
MQAQFLKTTLRPVLRTNKQCVHYWGTMSKEESQQNVLRLYKSLFKKLKWIRQVYHVPIPISQMKARVHDEFMLHKDVTDVSVLDRLCLEGYERFEDVLFHHTQRGHILDFFVMKDLKTPFPANASNKVLFELFGDESEDLPPKFDRTNLIRQ